MNVFRRFEVPAERMYEFYGGVLGFKQLSTLNVGNGGGVARFQAGAQELKLTRRVGDRQLRERRRARRDGLAAADVLLRRRSGAHGERFVQHGLPSPEFANFAARAGARRSSRIPTASRSSS